MQIINKSGRRKTAVARIYLQPGNGEITINKRSFKDYFTTDTLRKTLMLPFQLVSQEGKYDVKVNVSGGGITGQAEAIRLAISKALVEIDEANKPILKSSSLLTRDSRMVERKKPGQKKARKRFQFSKR
jgi:small subunit ribosomal protein S9